MSRPGTRWLPWAAVVVVVVTAGVLVIWLVPPSASVSGTRPVRTTGEPAPSPPTVESLAEPSPVPSTSSVAPVAARALVAAAEGAAAPGMTLGVAVLHVNTGELVVGRDGERRFMAASLSKLLLAVDVLDRHRAQGRPVDPADLGLIDRALSSSDDDAMNALWALHDGAGGVRRLAGELGLTASLPPGSTEMWGDTEVSAADMAAVYGHVLRDMAPQDGAVIVGALAAASPVATDGFAQHYGLLHRGPSPRHYAKQAWVPYSPAGYLLHSAGVAYDERTGHTYAVVLMSIQPHTGERAARDRLSAVAAAVLAPLTG